MSTFLGQLFWVLFWANQLQEILFLILWKNNFFWSKLFEQLFWVILLLKVLFWVNILFKVIFWGLFWVGLLFWGLFWVTFLLQTLFWVNLLKKLLKKVLKKVLKERSPQKSTQKSPFILLFEFKTFICLDGVWMVSGGGLDLLDYVQCILMPNQLRKVN